MKAVLRGRLTASSPMQGDTSETLTKGCPWSGLFESLLRCKSLKRFLLEDRILEFLHPRPKERGFHEVKDGFLVENYKKEYGKDFEFMMIGRDAKNVNDAIENLLNLFKNKA
ncbi:hypothetical protein K1720_00645 [Thermococcus argininiproducens]|uniref:Uncharacterized protein n=1 Tax=Thermococcus argininiproducens TaxID=2866384 RepID=A0A9E7M9R2_9EURY|nr:hypothetical protein [Thermococcus argininiproducens]USH00032.1 hypothetical protein K1720_00645 [Thermococcus argininiproducens]